MSIVLGMDGKLYRNTGTYGSPTWVLMNNVADNKISLDKATTDVTVRGNGGWRGKKGTLKDGGLQFKSKWDPSDAGFTALLNSWLNNTSIELLALDGPVGTTGSQGLRATMDVLKFERNEELENAMEADVETSPTYAANAPAWYTAA